MSVPGKNGHSAMSIPQKGLRHTVSQSDLLFTCVMWGWPAYIQLSLNFDLLGIFVVSLTFYKKKCL